jgi:hypothetical protein
MRGDGEFRQPGGLNVRDACEAGVDDDGDPSMVSELSATLVEKTFAAARGRMALLLPGVVAAEREVVGVETVVASGVHRGVISRAPGRVVTSSPSSPPVEAVERGGHLFFEGRRGVRRIPTVVSEAAFAAHKRNRSRPESRSPSRVADITTMRRLGRSAAAAEQRERGARPGASELVTRWRMPRRNHRGAGGA